MLKYLKNAAFSAFFALFSLGLVMFSVFAGSKPNEKIEKFYSLINKSQQCLDSVSDGIHINWRNALYNNAFCGDTELAIERAIKENGDSLKIIEENEPLINSVYKEIKFYYLAKDINSVFSAYINYYEFIINVGGSLKMFEENRKSFKNTLSTALDNLYKRI